MPKKGAELTDIEVEVLHETERAYLVDNGTVKVWVPKSQCELEGTTLTMPTTIAIEKGLV